MPLPSRWPHDIDQSSLCYAVGKDHSWHLLRKFLRNCHLYLYPIGFNLLTWLGWEAWGSGKYSLISGDLLFRQNCFCLKKVEELLMGNTYTFCFILFHSCNMSQYSGTCVHAKLLQLCLTLCDPHGLWPARLLCPWDSPGKDTGVGFYALLQGIFLIQRSNLPLLCLLHWQVGSLPLAPPGKPVNNSSWKEILQNVNNGDSLQWWSYKFLYLYVILYCQIRIK